MEKRQAVHKVFKTLTILKGIHAIIEILLGITLLVLSKEFISRGIITLVEGRLTGDPSGFISRYVSEFGLNLSLSIKLFFAIYLGSHGVVNLSLVYGIIKKPFIAYPLSLLVFIGFVGYQAYSYFVLSSVWLLAITLFDVLFIVLLFYEYHQHLKEYSFLGKLKLIVKAKVPRIVEIRLPRVTLVKNINSRSGFSIN